MSAPIQVKCSKCGTVLRFTPRGDVSLLKCPKCQQQLRIKTSGAAKPEPAAVNRPASAQPRPKAAPVQRSTASAATQPSGPVASAPWSSDLDWDDISSPPPRGPVPSFQASPSNRAAPAGSTKKKRKSSGGGGLKRILIGCGLLAGLSTLIVVGVVVALFYIGSTAQSKSTVSLAGYSVDAPGKAVGEKSHDGGISSAIHHRRTNSEFAIITKKIAMQGQHFEIEDVVEAMKRQAAITGPTKPVSRAGLRGYRMTMRQANGLKSESELYKINDQEVLMLSYVSGAVKHDAGVGKLNRNPDTIKKLDDPDAFFSSLRKD